MNFYEMECISLMRLYRYVVFFITLGLSEYVGQILRGDWEPQKTEKSGYKH